MSAIGKNVLIVFGTVFAVIALLVILVLFAIAKSGIVSIPLLSRLYVGPMPTHVVTADPISTDQFLALLELRVRAEAAKQRPPYEITITEQELTGALQSAIGTTLRGQGWERADAQIVLRPMDMEVLGRFKRGSVTPQILARFVPRIADGGVRFDPVYVQLGDYPLPPSIANNVLSMIFSRDFGTWTMSFGALKLEDVRISDGSVRLTTGILRP